MDFCKEISPTGPRKKGINGQQHFSSSFPISHSSINSTLQSYEVIDKMQLCQLDIAQLV